DIRKNVVEYDDVIARQREVIYADRRAVLERADMHERVLDMIRREVTTLVENQIPSNMVSEEEELESLFTLLENWMVIPDEILPDNLHAVRRSDLTTKLVDAFFDHYEEKGKQLDQLAADNPGLGIPTIRDVERSYTLQVLDRLWMDHIDALDVMRASIGFRSIGQRDPLVEFKNEAYRMFEELKAQIQHHIVDHLLRLLKGNITITVKPPETPRRKAPRALRTNAEAIASVSGQSKADESGEIVRATSRRQSSAQRQNGQTGAQRQNSRVLTTSPSPRPVSRIGRNDPCPCGSGKKYKRCHGA
ncbi:MAG TPA: SEC-C metal-binding domain-containing protein, partial [Ktedonobacteraceae bacterium]|nr:SEC-C metal-binding domain-containing protein [Ktedonobacteraceae bacterium]